MPNLSMIFDILAVDRASAVFSKVGDSAYAAGAKAETGMAKFETAVASVAKGAGVIGATVAVISLKMAADFQQAVTKLETTAGESHANLKMVGDGMLAMAGQVGISAGELAKGMYTVESAGYHGADALKVLKAAAEGAKQENADLGKVTDAVTTILHDYHLPASQAADVTSQLVTAVSHGKVSFDELTGSMHSVTPLAAQLHIPLSDIAGTLSAMTASGESAQQATDNMRNALEHLLTPTAPMIKELAQLGITSTDLSDRLGKRGLSGTMQDISQTILEKMGPSGKVLLDAFNQSKIAAQDAGTMYNNLPPALKKLADSYSSGSITVAQWRAAIKALPADQQTLAMSWKTGTDNANGFNQALKSGGINAQSYMTALQKATGTQAGLTVALMTTGENAAATNAAIQDISNSSAQADGNIKGWAEVQKNFNQQLAQAGAQLGAMAIEIGQKLLPVATGFVSWLNGTGLPAIKGIGGGIADAVKWFSQLPGPVKDAALAFAAFKAVEMLGWFDKLGSGITMARVVMSEFGDSVRGSMGKVSGAFAEAKSASAFMQTLDGGAANRLTGSIAGMGAAAGAAAKGGLSLLKSAGSGLMSMFGGPWGLAFAGAALGVGALNSMIQHHDEQVKKATDDVAKWFKTLALGGSAGDMNAATQHLSDLRSKISALQGDIDAYNKAAATGSARGGIGTLISQQKDLRDELAKGEKAWKDYWSSLTPQQKVAEQVAIDETNLAEAIKRHGAASDEARAAATKYQTDLALQKGLLDHLSAAEQTQIDKVNQLANAQLGAVSSALGATQAQASLADAVDQYNADAKDGQHTTRQLADESNNLAVQAINAAQSAGKQAADQAKVNGVTDDGTLANKAILDSLKASADHITGPGHDALVKAIDDLQKTTIGSGTLADSVSKMGLTTAATFDANTQVIKGATDQQIKDLQGLGYTVTHLPDGSIEVTADTGPARDQMDQLAKDYANKQIAIAGGNAGPAAMRVPGAGTGGYAEGGYTGPGGKYEPAGIVHKGEFVVPQEAVNRIGVHALGQLSGLPGYASGGMVGLPSDMRNNMPAVLSQLAMQQAEAIIASMVPTFTGGGGGGGSPLIRALGQNIANSMGYGGQFSAIDFIFTHESGWNPNAQNPTSSAYGIPQFLNSTWAQYGGKTSDPATQIRDGIQYMHDRYGSPNGAASFWQGHHWYDGGGYLMPGVTMAYNGTGKPERIRTAEQESALHAGAQVTLRLDGAATTALLEGHAVKVVVGALEAQHNDIAYGG